MRLPLVVGTLTASLLASSLAQPAIAAQACTVTSTGLVPLNDLGIGTCSGFQGGLYSGGSNVRPIGHEVGGVCEAQQVIPPGTALPKKSLKRD